MSQRSRGRAELQTVPDAVVRRADQIELVDVTPEALRRRMAHGNIYPPERIDGALSHYFRLENLGALRELALEWMAGHADQRLAAYREERGAAEHWDTRERVVVALTGARGSEKLLRRGARMAARTHAELVAVHVHDSDRPSAAAAALDEYRALVADLGGRFTTVRGDHVASSLVAFARSENATQLLLGATRETRWRELRRGSVIKGVLRVAGPLDVHVVSTQDQPPGHLERTGARSGLSRQRRLVGWLLALGGTPLLAFALLPLRNGSASLPSVLLLLLLGTVGVAVVGGGRPGVASAVVAVGFADWYFVPPIHTWRVAHTRDLVILVSFVVIAVVVSTLSDALARRGAESRRARVPRRKR